MMMQRQGSLRAQCYVSRFLVVALLSAARGFGQEAAAAGQTLPVEDGRAVFAQNCAGCHGAEAQGSDRAPKLVGSRFLRSRSIEQLKTLIEHGIPSSGMPAFPFPPPRLEAI